MKNRARFYINKLKDKGWSDEEICKFCNIDPVRYAYLQKIQAIPRRLEASRLRGMMKRPTAESMRIVKEVWASKSRASTEKPQPLKYTDRQMDTLRTMAKATRMGHPSTVLERTDASIAARLRDKGITFVETDMAGGKKFKRYGLTKRGVSETLRLGIAAQEIAGIPADLEEARKRALQRPLVHAVDNSSPDPSHY